MSDRGASSDRSGQEGKVGADSSAAIGDIVLIGPTHVGKTSVGRVLAARLGVEMVSMDDVRAHRSNYELATFVVLTANRSPEEIAGEILRSTGV